MGKEGERKRETSAQSATIQLGYNATCVSHGAATNVYKNPVFDM